VAREVVDRFAANAARADSDGGRIDMVRDEHPAAGRFEPQGERSFSPPLDDRPPRPRPASEPKKPYVPKAWPAKDGARPPRNKQAGGKEGGNPSGAKPTGGPAKGAGADKAKRPFGPKKKKSNAGA
jgi:hypothetical protein